MSHQSDTAAQKQERRFIDEKVTAVVMCATPKQLQQMRYRGEGPPYHKLGTGRKAKVVYDYDEVVSWIDEHKVIPGKPPGGK